VVDPITIAAAATPFLLKAVEALGDKVWDKTSDAAADEAAGFGRRLLARLLRRSDGPDADPDADTGSDTGSDVVAVAGARDQAGVARAVHDLVTAPGDQDLQAALRLAVRRLLAADPVLMAEVADMVAQHTPAQQAGDRSILLGGAQHGGVNVTGDSNKISYGGPGQT
jgi:hypothetical protein